MILVRRSTLKLLSIGMGLLFVGAIYADMHYGRAWDWAAPGLGKLPEQVVRAYLTAGDAATQGWLAPGVKPAARPAAPYEIHTVVAQGLKVVVFRQPAAADQTAGPELIDLFDVRNGRITGHRHYQTSGKP